MAVLPIGFCGGAYRGVVPFNNSSRRVSGAVRKARGTDRRNGRSGLTRVADERSTRALDAGRPMSEIEVVRMTRHREPRAGSFSNRF